MQRWRYGILAFVVTLFAILATVAVSRLYAGARSPAYILALLYLGDAAFLIVSVRLFYLAIRPGSTS